MKLVELIITTCCPSEPGLLRGWVTQEEIERCDDLEEFVINRDEIVRVEHTWGHCYYDRDERASFIYVDDKYKGKQGGFKVTEVEVRMRDES